jgi:hypothetical protein
MFDYNLSAIENLNPMMDTVSLLKERMGYTDKLRCCIECKNYKNDEQVCKVSNMGNIPVKPTGTCNYYKRAEHIEPSEGDLIYQYRVNGGNGKWITVEKQWYDNIAGAINVERQIITQK